MGDNTPNIHDVRRNSTRTALTAEDIVVLAFAVVGLIGAVVLNATGLAGPTIVSFFLATGISSLVYRFLGGIRSAKLVWGAVRFTGSLAALIGTALIVHSMLSNEPRYVSGIEGTYEWQWSGEGWFGHIDINKEGVTTIQMIRYLKCGNSMEQKTLMQADGEGKVESRENGTKLQVHIPVKFMEYDDSCNMRIVHKTLDGVIGRKRAFAGSIHYITSDSSSKGDMVLVDTNSAVYPSQ